MAVDDKGEVTIPRVDIAVDCGAEVNPERVRAQMRGRGGAWAWASRRCGEITFKNGRVEQNNFDGYEMTRIDAAPREIRVHLVRPATTTSRWAASASPACRRCAGALQRDLRRHRQAHPRGCRSATS